MFGTLPPEVTMLMTVLVRPEVTMLMTELLRPEVTMSPIVPVYEDTR